MVEREATVRNNQQVARNTFLMTLECDFPQVIPGQFLMLRLTSTWEPFLRRPLAVLSYKDGTLELLYRIKGEGTALLAGKKKGERLSVFGPLGNGFSLPREEETVVYVAGGTGLPPILALAEKVERGCLIVGSRAEEDVPLRARIQSIRGVRLLTTTEDGSLGRRGMATDALADFLENVSSPCIVYACGPEGMLEKTARLAEKIGARCEVSLEEYMACGFGVCSACVVKTTAGNRKVCSQGPVFDAFSIRWGD